MHLSAGLSEPGGDRGRGAVLVVRQLRVGVQVAVERFLPAPDRRESVEHCRGGVSRLNATGSG